MQKQIASYFTRNEMKVEEKTTTIAWCIKAIQKGWHIA